MSGDSDECLILGHVCVDGLTEGESSCRSGPWLEFIMTPGQITSHLYRAIDIRGPLRWQREETLGMEEWKSDLWVNK